MLESLSFTFLLRGGREEDERKMGERVEGRWGWGEGREGIEEGWRRGRGRKREREKEVQDR